MLFIKNENLKTGMRLAKPIYNKQGVLLYDRNSKLTLQGIDSVKNFGLIGLYILEPAEPVPPMTQEDIEFERFQTMSVFSIQEELLMMKNSGKAPKMQMIASNIIKSYGRLEKKINFVQSLRSNEDYVFKHSLNCAVLCAMMTHVLNVKLDEQLETVISAVVHDVGKLNIPKEIQDKGGNLSTVERAQASYFERQSAEIVENTFASNPGIKRIVTQAYHTLNDWRDGKDVRNAKLVIGAKVMIVAEVFDTMTAMNHVSEPSSEVAALRYLMENPVIFDQNVVNALIKSVNILNAGCCIELSNGEKGLVIVANEVDILKPIILCFRDNRMIDLSHELVYEDLTIKDVMKTMDNRCVLDKEMVKQYGFANGLHA